MGKSRGGKYRHKPRPGGGAGRGEDEEGSEEEEYVAPNRGLGGQSSNVGMLPPSDSEDEEEEGEKGKEGAEGSKPKPKAEPKPAGQSKNVGKMPTDSEDDSEEDSEDESSDDDAPMPEYLTAPKQPKKVVQEDRDPDQIRKDLERLELIRKKREDDRKKRIADEGWDRFAPISDTNRPPGYVPSDHPSHKA